MLTSIDKRVNCSYFKFRPAHFSFRLNDIKAEVVKVVLKMTLIVASFKLVKLYSSLKSEDKDQSNTH